MGMSIHINRCVQSYNLFIQSTDIFILCQNSVTLQLELRHSFLYHLVHTITKVESSHVIVLLGELLKMTVMTPSTLPGTSSCIRRVYMNKSTMPISYQITRNLQFLHADCHRDLYCRCMSLAPVCIVFGNNIDLSVLHVSVNSKSGRFLVRLTRLMSRSFAAVSHQCDHPSALSSSPTHPPHVFHHTTDSWHATAKFHQTSSGSCTKLTMSQNTFAGLQGEDCQHVTFKIVVGPRMREGDMQRRCDILSILAVSEQIYISLQC